ncbi:hypothetical protein GCM10012275_42970 [Longimycelium tulufanense]|uniref:Uncharacterized protein n=1 Tax=Longimycelium tulufanense TaxID=907463 RepID=A0A8J3CGY8_9PSEU|nr:hypothetical protein [Longimycelium tulufanense]GGM67771.1 hypothetical protein GCM10012275_42970 [Longimycelium tulufanense]
MSHSVAISDEITELAALVKAGDLAAARRRARTLLDTVNPETLAILARCVATLERYPFPSALPRLRQAWRDHPNHRDLIAACVPDTDPGVYRPDIQPARPNRYGRHNYRAPRDHRTWTDPTRRRARRIQREEPRTATEYFDSRAGVDDAPARAERPIGYALDYDKAAVPDVRGLPCVACWLERSRADVHARRARAGHGDDGLCHDCRERGRPGIPELPPGHTLADAVAARCAHIAAHTGNAAHAILRREWQRAGHRAHRDLIAAWVQAHPLPATTQDDTPTEPAPSAAPAGCVTCGDLRQVRDGLCVDCRKLDDGPTDDAAAPPRAA